ncbi:MAG TPA: hypothetical protein DCL38_00400 [Lachnospiraceae bacterium]|nr:hypothetical protein [Lachnospiraceae bacterium]
MIDWSGSVNFSILGAALLLSILGIWFIVILPGIDRFTKRFFLSYFVIFMLCCLSVIVEIAFQYYMVPRAVFNFLLLLESQLLSLPLPMLTIYLLHCCGEDLRSSRLFHTVLGLWAVYSVLLAVSPFVGSFTYIMPDNRYYRGPLYPLFLVPMIAVQFLNLAGTIRRRKQLSRKLFLSFLIAILPMTVTLIVNLFVDIFELISIFTVLSALSMYGLILSDQIEQDRLRQSELLLKEQEIAKQQREIANQRTSVMVLQMRPHFIYNTLMTIYSLCGLEPLKARQITLDFTNYLRRNFNAVAKDTPIPFSTELEHTRAYLSVEQAQYDDMLFVDYDTPFIHFRLPSLTLQPIVENAVKHGMDPNSEPLHISIRTKHLDSVTEIIVEDNGRGFEPSEENKPHIALNNIRQRLELMCGGKMTIISRKGDGTTVTITIPDGASD